MVLAMIVMDQQEIISIRFIYEKRLDDKKPLLIRTFSMSLQQLCHDYNHQRCDSMNNSQPVHGCGTRVQRARHTASSGRSRRDFLGCGDKCWCRRGTSGSRRCCQNIGGVAVSIHRVVFLLVLGFARTSHRRNRRPSWFRGIDRYNSKSDLFLGNSGGSRGNIGLFQSLGDGLGLTEGLGAGLLTV
jgi:hypothetical protein